MSSPPFTPASPTSPPPSLHSTPRQRHQQLQQQLRALQTTLQTYTTTPTHTVLTAALPSLATQLARLRGSLAGQTPALLLPAVPALLDGLDALGGLGGLGGARWLGGVGGVGGGSGGVLDVAGGLVGLLVWWARRAGRWVGEAEESGRGSAVYGEVVERVRDGYVRLGAAAEQWAAAVSLSAPSTPAAVKLLPALLTALALSLPYLSAAPRDSSVDLLLSSLNSSTTCTALLSSPHLVDLLSALPSALSSALPTRQLAVTEAVLSLWRRGGVVGVRPYDEYRAVMAYTGGVCAFMKADVATVRQLQQLCVSAVESSASNAAQSLFALYAVLGMLLTLDVKAAAFKRYRDESAKPSNGENNTSLTVTKATTSAASSSASPVTSVPSPASSSTPAPAPTSIHLPTILSLQSTFQSTVSTLLPSCLPASSPAALTAMSPPSFAASQCGLLSAACVSGVEWLPWSDALFSFVTTAFLTLIDTRWCIAGTASLSSPPPSHTNGAMLEWTRSSFFALLPHYSRAFSTLFLGAPPQQQCDALSQVRDRVRDIHRQWQRYNRASSDTDIQQLPAGGMEEDSAQDDEEDEGSSDETTSDTRKPNSTQSPHPPPPPFSQPPPIDRHTLSELQNTLFLSVCMALATVCRQPPSQLPSWPTAALCDVVDTLAWLEFVRVNFSGYRDVVVAVVEEGVRREAAGDGLTGAAKQGVASGLIEGSEKQPGWLGWLMGWRRRRKSRDGRLQTRGLEAKLSDSHQPPPNGVVQTFLNSYVLPSVGSSSSSSASALHPTAPLFPSSTLTPLFSVDESDVVALSRHYFLLGLLSEWQENCTADDALSVLLPYSASFVHCRLRGILKRAHGLFARSLALIVRQHSLQGTDATVGGYDLVLAVLLPYARLVLAQYPMQLGLPTLMDSLVLLFHLLPSDHPLLLDASHAIVDRIRQLTDRALASALSSSSTIALGSDALLSVPTSIRHLLILHLQLVQLLSLASFRTALVLTGGLFPTAVAEAAGGGVGVGLYGGMLGVLRDVIVRNFDLYRRDEAVRWWMAVKQRAGIVLAVPGPPPPLPVAAPSITTVKPST